VAPAVANAGGGCHDGQFSDQQGVRVELRDICFTPTVIRIEPGQSVTWTNKDDTAHTVTGSAVRWGSFDELSLDDTATYRFKASGVFPYFCLLHPGMVGAVVVGDGTSASTTTQAAVPVPPVQSAPPAAPEAAPVATTASSGVSSVWRILALAALALIVVALAGWVAQRFSTRRRTTVGA